MPYISKIKLPNDSNIYDLKVVNKLTINNQEYDGSSPVTITTSDTKYTAGENVQISDSNVISATDTNTYTSVYCDTASGTQNKIGTCTNFKLTKGYFLINFVNNNSYSGQINLNINNTGNKVIYINGIISSATNCTLPAGTYLVSYPGTYFFIDTRGMIPNGITSDTSLFCGNIFGNNRQKLYINKFTDAMYCATKKWTVTGSYTNGTTTTTINQTDLEKLFDGSYESGMDIPAGNICTIRITFDTNDYTMSYNGVKVFQGYPYGNFFITYYSDMMPEESSTMSVYCNHESHGIGVHTSTMQIYEGKLGGTGPESVIEYLYNGYYAISYVEFKIKAGTKNIRPTSIELHMNRPGSNEIPCVSKYTSNKMYYDLTGTNFIGNLIGNGNYYGTCTTAATTAAKVVTITNPGNGFKLQTGAIIGVNFTYSNTASNVTLNVNNTGAKSICYSGNVYSSTSSTVCGSANHVTYYMYDGTYWRWLNLDYMKSDTIPTGYCDTAANTAAKVASCSNFTATADRYIPVSIRYTNSYAGAITLNINNTGAKPIYINGIASSSSNYYLTAGSYIVYYDGSKYYFQTDGTIYNLISKGEESVQDVKIGTSSIVDNNGIANIPKLSQRQNGTSPTLVTDGDIYNWNHISESIDAGAKLVNYSGRPVASSNQKIYIGTTNPGSVNISTIGAGNLYLYVPTVS